MHKGWYSRGYLPHFDAPDLNQMITIRLEDALPMSLVKEWKRSLTKTDGTIDKKALHKRCEKYLDAGHGACYLRNETVSKSLKMLCSILITLAINF
jgi:putative transposase